MKKGFTLIELMIVVAIIAFLAMVSVPSFMRFLAKAKRAEAYMNLGSIYAAQKAYWAEHSTYSPTLMGTGGIGWEAESQPYYSYGFAGQEGKNYILGKNPGPQEAFSQAKATKNNFIAVATAYLKNDTNPDIITINEKKEVKIIQDGLLSQETSKQSTRLD